MMNTARGIRRIISLNIRAKCSAGSAHSYLMLHAEDIDISLMTYAYMCYRYSMPSEDELVYKRGLADQNSCGDRNKGSIPTGTVGDNITATQDNYHNINIPNLYVQELMRDFYGLLEQATASGIKYGELIPSNNWEYIFAPPRQ